MDRTRPAPFGLDIGIDLRAECYLSTKSWDLQSRGLIVPWVFYRMVANERRGPKFPRKVTAFNKAWAAACTAAGCPGRIPHDLRRSAVRNLVRANIPERVAMQLTGHKTRSVFERYNIVSDGDLVAAARRLDEAHGHSLGIVRAVGASDAMPTSRSLEEKLEAPPGIEPGMEVLQEYWTRPATFRSLQRMPTRIPMSSMLSSRSTTAIVATALM
jgi:hypothetical protein